MSALSNPATVPVPAGAPSEARSPQPFLVVRGLLFWVFHSLCMVFALLAGLAGFLGHWSFSESDFLHAIDWAEVPIFFAAPLIIAAYLAQVGFRKILTLSLAFNALAGFVMFYFFEACASC